MRKIVVKLTTEWMPIWIFQQVVANASANTAERLKQGNCMHAPLAPLRIRAKFCFVPSCKWNSRKSQTWLLDLAPKRLPCIWSWAAARVRRQPCIRFRSWSPWKRPFVVPGSVGRPQRDLPGHSRRRPPKHRNERIVVVVLVVDSSVWSAQRLAWLQEEQPTGAIG